MPKIQLLTFFIGTKQTREPSIEGAQEVIKTQLQNGQPDDMKKVHRGDDAGNDRRQFLPLDFIRQCFFFTLRG